MVGYEYKVVPAPSKGRKAPGVKGPEARFAHVLEQQMNDLAADGWEYQRADILPSEERQGLTSSHIVYRSVLVFRRPLTDAADQPVEETPVAGEDEIEAEAEEVTADAVEEERETGADTAKQSTA